jgi:hypothetical protein
MPVRITHSRRDLISVIFCRRFATFGQKLDFICHRIIIETQELRIRHCFRLQVGRMTEWFDLRGSLDKIVSNLKKEADPAFETLCFNYTSTVK